MNRPQAPVSVARYRWEVMKKELLDFDPTLAHDEQALFDTCDGLTDLTDQIAALVRSADIDHRFAKAIKGRITELQTRMARLDRTSEKKRSIALHTMADADIKKITAEDMTISRRKVIPGLVIVNEELVSSDYKKTVTTVTIDRKALRAALDDGVLSPGAMLGNESETLLVRTC